MKTVAIIGCGALGRALAHGLCQTLPQTYRVSGVLAHTSAHAQALADEIGCRACFTLDELLADAPDYVVEIAGTGAVREYGAAILRQKCGFIIVSAGALADTSLRESLARAAEASGSRIYVASGAVGGFDLMRTFALIGLQEAAIDNRKAPASLNGAPYLAGQTLSETEEQAVFSGDMQAAIAGFPKNVNVAVATALASGEDRTSVTIESVPGLTENCHVIRLKSKTSHAEISISSAPDPANPRSSTFAAWSVIALLENLSATISFF